MRQVEPDRLPVLLISRLLQKLRELPRAVNADHAGRAFQRVHPDREIGEIVLRKKGVDLVQVVRQGVLIQHQGVDEVLPVSDILKAGRNIQLPDVEELRRHGRNSRHSANGRNRTCARHGTKVRHRTGDRFHPGSVRDPRADALVCHLLLRQVGGDHLLELHRRDRLRQVIVEAGLQVFLPRAGQRVRRKADDRHRVQVPRVERAQLMQRLDAVHDRHPLVQQDEIIFIRGIRELMETLLPGRRGIDRNPGLLQQSRHDLQIHRRVVHREDPRVFRVERHVVIVPLRGEREPEREVPDRPLIQHVLLQVEVEYRTHAVDAQRPDAAAHEVQQLLRDIHAKARALDGAVALLVDPLERAEQLRHLLFPHADARVRHTHPEGNFPGLPVRVLQTDPQLHEAAVRVFDAVRQEVQQDLLDAHDVAL